MIPPITPVLDPPALGSGHASVRVVLVDDHLSFRAGLRELLGFHGLDVVGEAADGDAELQLVQETAPDVVVMDLDMPVMDGLAATRAIRALPGPDAAVPIVAVTARTDVASRAAVKAAGMSGFMGKPLRMRALARFINETPADSERSASRATSYEPSAARAE